MRYAWILFAIAAPASGQASLPFLPNNPVSAAFEIVHTRTLQDGTHITSTSHESVYRDSAGHLREENVFNDSQVGSSDVVIVTDWQARTSIGWTTWTGRPDPRMYSRSVIQDAPPVRPGSPTTKTSVEDLGDDNVQGIPCHVWRVTSTVPEGFVGNDHAYTHVTEECHSPEFGALRLSFGDPVSGATTMTLRTLTRGEPDAALFQPPAGYTEAPTH